MIKRKSRWVFRICCLAAVAVVLSMVATSLILESSRAGAQGSKTRTRIRKINVRSFAEGLKVVKLERHGGEARLTLRNDYDKTISSLAHSLAPENNNTSESFSVDPGASRALEVDLMESVPHSRLPEFERTITIIAVTFSDNTGDGNPKVVQEMLDGELGHRIQRERISRILQDFSIDTDLGLLEALDNLVSKIRSMPEPPEAEKSWSLRASIRSQTELALIRINELKQAYESEGLDRCKSRLEGIKLAYRKTTEVPR